MARISPSIRFGPLLVLVLMATAFAWISQPFTPPKAFHAKTYPAHDAHDDEKVTIAADPYDMADKQSATFHVKYRDHDLLPIYILISNDGDKPISAMDLQALLITRQRAKIRPATNEDIFRRIGRPPRKDAEAPIDITPRIPFPGRKKKGLSESDRDEVEAAQLGAKIIEPHSTAAGFLFFDVMDIDEPLAGAKLEITGLKDSSGTDLFFFEIPMEKYLSYQPLKP